MEQDPNSEFVPPEAQAGAEAVDDSASNRGGAAGFTEILRALNSDRVKPVEPGAPPVPVTPFVPLKEEQPAAAPARTPDRRGHPQLLQQRQPEVERFVPGPEPEVKKPSSPAQMFNALDTPTEAASRIELVPPRPDPAALTQMFGSFGPRRGVRARIAAMLRRHPAAVFVFLLLVIAGVVLLALWTSGMAL